MTLSRQHKIFDEKFNAFYKGDLTTNETVMEFDYFHSNMYWCADILSSIDLDRETEIYKERVGDEYVVQQMRDFVDMRLDVAREHLTYVATKDFEEKDKRAIAIKRAEKFVDYARKSLSWSNINAAVTLWKKIKCIEARELNKHENLMGTPVGVYEINSNLLTTNEYEMIERNYRLCQNETMSTGRGLFITKSTRGRIENMLYEYQAGQELKPDPRWQKFINEIMCGNKELAAYLQRALGYSAFVSGNPEECMFLAHGASTRNGKSTLLNSVQYALGDYATAASNDFLLKKKFTSQGDKDELAYLQGVHLLIISEPPLGEEMDESKTKSFTGNDSITCSKKYGRTFSYAPQFTMWCMSNSLPVIRDVSLVTSERVQVVPFERHFERSEQDTTLKTRFQTERGMYTILSWLHKGYKEYKRQGLNPPQIVREASAQLSALSGNDFDLFTTTCLINKTGTRVSRDDFKELYLKWCEQTGADVRPVRQVNNLLRERGFGRQRSNGQDYYTSMMFSGGAEGILKFQG